MLPAARAESFPSQPSPTLRLADAAVGELPSSKMVARIAALEAEVELLRRRDRALSQYMLKLDEEQRLAARIQQEFLPKSLPHVGPIRFATLFRPASYVSGDLFDVTRLDENHAGIYLADAVGHGMPAALLTMFMRSALTTKEIRSDGYRLLEPNEVLAALNAALRSQELSSSSFATAVYACVDFTDSTVRFARGGHPNPIILSPDGTTEEVPCDGQLLGVFDDGEWEVSSAQLKPGQRMLFYSDGIEVLFRSDPKTPDVERWKTELVNLASKSTEEIIEFFKAANDASVNHADARDDLTLIVVEHVG